MPLLSTHEAEGLAAETGAARGLPGRLYGAEALEAERHRVFAGGWVAVATGARLPRPGDALPVDLAGWKLLLVRQADQTIRAYFNICRHRAMRLVAQPGRLPAGLIRCPWHSWSYALDGRLVATPHYGGYRCAPEASPDRAALGLREIRVATWLDYVFVDISGTAPPLDEHLAPLTALLAGYDLSAIVHAGGWQYPYPGNWKIAIEGAVEDYHLPWGHPQLMEGVASHQARTGGAVGVYSYTLGLSDPKSPPELPLLPGRPSPHMNPAIINLFPTGIIGLQPDHVMLGLALPDGADRSTMTFDYYFTREGMAEEHAPARARAIAGWEDVVPQDDDFVAGVQEMAAIRDAAGVNTIFAPVWEGAVHLFQQSVAAALAG